MEKYIERMEELRVSHGLTVDQFCKITRSEYNKLITTKQTIPYSIIKRICNNLSFLSFRILI